MSLLDQAHSLRELANRTSNDVQAVVSRRRAAATSRTIAITSGKGGVGKSNITAGLAIALSRRGQRVIVVDADLGLANIHLLFGVSPIYGLPHVISGQMPMEEVLFTGPEKVRLLAGGGEVAEVAQFAPDERQRLLTAMKQLEEMADFVLIDTGAGISSNVLTFLASATELLLVTTPEPTALADAYATLKTVAKQQLGTRMMLAINVVGNRTEGEATALRLVKTCRQFLQMEPEIIGLIPRDASVPIAVRRQQPLLTAFPQCAAAQAISGIAERLLASKAVVVAGRTGAASAGAAKSTRKITSRL